MQTLQFSSFVHCAQQKLWTLLWNDETYRIWTSVFSEGSYAETDWQQDSKVLFLDGKGSGMVSRIKQKEEPNVMVFEHLGMAANGVEDTSSAEVLKWAGATEGYKLKAVPEGTLLMVSMQASDEWKEYLGKKWPLALEKIRQLAENN